MSRFEIIRGEVLLHLEPYDLPGAFICRRHKVIDATGAVPSEAISWSGPGEWIESRDNVPDGYVALWLGTRNATRPHVVFVQREPTPESLDYERGYRRAFAAKRRPVVRETMPRAEIDGVLDGWRDRRAYLSDAATST